jgi:hypothetical protein
MQVYECSFQAFESAYARRESNLASHVCAKSAFGLESSVVDYDYVPGFLSSIVTSELISLSNKACNNGYKKTRFVMAHQKHMESRYVLNSLQ